MKRVKGIRKTLHKLLVKATSDYYGTETNKNVMQYICGENVELSETEKADARKIKFNLLDETYTKNLAL